MAFLKEKIEIKVQEAELNVKNTFLSFSPRARVYLVVMVIAIIPTYFLGKFAAKKIWLNQNQDLIAQAKPSFTQAQDLQISPVEFINAGSGNYAAAVKITNQNLDLWLRTGQYRFIFYNNDKQKVFESPGVVFLKPDQTKYVVLSRFTSPEAVAYADFEIPEAGRVWQKRIDVPQVDFTVSKAVTYQQQNPPALVVEGNFVNNSPYAVSKVRLIFIIRDFSGKIIAMSQRDESNIRAFERRAYKQLWPDLNTFNIASVDVFADTNVLDPQNLSTGG